MNRLLIALAMAQSCPCEPPFLARRRHQARLGPAPAGTAQEPTTVVTPAKSIDRFQTLTKAGGDVEITIVSVVAGEATCRKEHGAGPCDEDPAAPSTLQCPPAVNPTSVATVYRTVLATLPHNATAEAAAPLWP